MQRLAPHLDSKRRTQPHLPPSANRHKPTVLPPTSTCFWNVVTRAEHRPPPPPTLSIHRTARRVKPRPTTTSIIATLTSPTLPLPPTHLMQAPLATDYTTILDRGRAPALAPLRRELSRIINAPPTLMHPEDRGGFLVAILADLAPDGLWMHWPDDGEWAGKVVQDYMVVVRDSSHRRRLTLTRACAPTASPHGRPHSRQGPRPQPRRVRDPNHARSPRDAPAPHGHLATGDDGPARPALLAARERGDARAGKHARAAPACAAAVCRDRRRARDRPCARYRRAHARQPLSARPHRIPHHCSGQVCARNGRQ